MTIRLLAACLLFSGCSVLGIKDGPEGELKDEKSAWLKLGIHNYSYVQETICFCPIEGPVKITVRADTIASRTYVNSGQPAGANAGRFYTVPGLYDFLIDAAKNSDQMDVSFDRMNHLPTDVSIDYYKNAIDDELGLRISAFVKL